MTLGVNTVTGDKLTADSALASHCPVVVRYAAAGKMFEIVT